MNQYRAGSNHEYTAPCARTPVLPHQPALFVLLRCSSAFTGIALRSTKGLRRCSHHGYRFAPSRLPFSGARVSLSRHLRFTRRVYRSIQCEDACSVLICVAMVALPWKNTRRVASVTKKTFPLENISSARDLNSTLNSSRKRVRIQNGEK